VLKILWLPSARRDIQELTNFYTAEANSRVAHNLVAKIVKAAALLAENPLLGHATEDSDTLEWAIPSTNYTLPYRVQEQRLEILRVFHQSQRKPYKWEAL